MDDYSKGKNLPYGYVPGTTFWLIDDKEFVGTFVIRHYLTPKLEEQGGHIAANISPKYRGKYSSFIGVKLCLEEASKLGLKRVLMTCDETYSRNSNNELVCNTEVFELSHEDEATDNFSIKISFDSQYNDLSYANLIDYLNVDIRSYQKV